MRDAFIKSLLEEIKTDSSIILLTADLGFGVFEELETKHPNQYINVGVAEQNMVGVATGLSMEGFRTLTYSIGNFPTLRCLEQIRNDACYHEINLTIVGMGGGFSYGPLGMSHHATEDLAIMRSLPNMKVVAPGTEEEAFFAIKELIKSTGVSYLRLDKKFAKPNKILKREFKLGKSIKYREGNDISIFSTGGILDEVLKAADNLEKKGIKTRVYNFHTIKPLDGDSIKKAVLETNGIITIEEHNLIGGLSSAVCEYCMKEKLYPNIFKSIGLNDEYSSIVGNQDYLRSQYKINANEICSIVNKFFNK